MEGIRAVGRYIRVSPRKARLVVDLIRGEDLAKAQQILEYTPRAAARVVAKVLDSAAANAENNAKISPDGLFVARAFVDEGPTLKRFQPRAMGRATRINKRTSHITIILEEKALGVSKKRRRFRRRKPDAGEEKGKRAKEVEPEEGKAGETSKGKKEPAPEGKEKTAAKGGTGETAAKKPAAKKPAGKKEVAAKKTAAEKPAGEKKASSAKTKKPAAEKPAGEKKVPGKKTTAKKPAAKKPAAKKPAGEKKVPGKKTTAKKPAGTGKPPKKSTGGSKSGTEKGKD